MAKKHINKLLTDPQMKKSGEETTDTPEETPVDEPAEEPTEEPAEEPEA